MKLSVLVTGGARRIGRRICEVLASSGWDVVIHSRDENDADAINLANSLSSQRVWGDLSDEAEVKKIFASAHSNNSNLTAIVNNASLFSTRYDLSDEEEKKIHQVNYGTPHLLTHLLFEKLKSEKQVGSVVNLIDTRVLTSNYVKTPYAESKRALLDFTLKGARCLAPVLRINGIAPGPVLLPSGEGTSEKGGAILLSSRPSIDDVANAVSFLLNTSSITGQVLAVDSGQHLIADEIMR